FERAAVEGVMWSNVVDVLLHGHLHMQRPRDVNEPNGRVLVLAAGATFQGRRDMNLAYVVELDETEYRIQAIEFREDDAGIWMPRPYRSPDGIWHCHRTGGHEPAVSQPPQDLGRVYVQAYVQEAQANLDRDAQIASDLFDAGD